MKSGNKRQNVALHILTLTVMALLINSPIMFVFAQPHLMLNISTDKQIYKVGETVKITGNVTESGSPVSDALVAIQVDSTDNEPYVVRTAPTGLITGGDWKVNITEFFTCDSLENPKDTFPIGSMASYKIKWRNYDAYPKPVKIAAYIEFSNKVPYYVNFPVDYQMPPETEESLTVSFEIPAYAPLGATTIYANIYTAAPKNDGYAYCPEKNATFTITTTLAGSSPPASPVTTLSPPNFGVEFSLAAAAPGTYDLYGAVSYGGSQVSNMLSFGVQPMALPPIAYFSYSPSPPGVNLTTTFDASGSLPVGFNDTIIRLEWLFGDGTPKVVVNGTFENPPNPKVDHVFTNNQTYTVTLNVTDNEGFWNTTSKQVSVFLIISPTADFTWSPQLPIVNRMITFDAGISKLGWNGTAHPPIVSYQWDFGNGYVRTVNTTTTDYYYTSNDTYTVTLTVTDAGGQQGYKSKTILIMPQPPAGNPDVDGDGRVTMGDIVIVVSAFGSYPGHPRWDPRADIDGDGVVTMTDIIIVVDNFGKTV